MEEYKSNSDRSKGQAQEVPKKRAEKVITAPPYSVEKVGSASWAAFFSPLM